MCSTGDRGVGDRGDECSGRSSSRRRESGQGQPPARGAANPNRAKLRTPAQLNEKAPETFRARFDTSAGPFVIEVHRAWSPLGADRFYNLVKNGFYDDTRFFRVLDGFMVQFGINGDPTIARCGATRNSPTIR